MKKTIVIRTIVLILFVTFATFVQPMSSHAESSANVISSLSITTTEGNYQATIQNDRLSVIIPESINNHARVTGIHIMSDAAKTIESTLFPSKKLKFTNGSVSPNLDSPTLKSFLGTSEQTDPGIFVSTIHDFLSDDGFFHTTASVVTDDDVSHTVTIEVITEKQYLIHEANNAIAALPSIDQLSLANQDAVAEARTKVNEAVRVGAALADIAEYAKLTNAEAKIDRLLNPRDDDDDDNDNDNNSKNNEENNQAEESPSDYQPSNTPFSKVKEELSKAGVKDVEPDSWYGSSVVTLLKAGLIKPNQDGEIKPNQPLTKASSVSVFAKVLGIAPKNASDEDALKSAKAAGMIGKDAESTAPFTRLEAARLIGKALGIQPIPMRYEMAAFTDMKSLNSEDRSMIQALNQIGIFNGYDDGTFRPNAVLTTAQLSMLITRILGD